MGLPAPMTLLRLLAPCSGGRLRFRLKRRRQLAVTFDDGPRPETTPLILDALATAGARATFFVQGTAATVAPHLIRRAHGEGHCIGSHGMTHVSARKQSAAAAVANATQCHDLLQQLIGSELPRIYRPPYGELSLPALRGLLEAGFRLEFWNRDSQDSFVDSAAELRSRFLQFPPGDGDILLFHDDYRITAEALPDLLRQIADAGLATARLEANPT